MRACETEGWGEMTVEQRAEVINQVADRNAAQSTVIWILVLGALLFLRVLIALIF